MLAHFNSSGKDALVTSAPFQWPPQAGALLGGKYRLLRILGQGGMGIVWQATHEGLDEAVAIKILLDDGVDHRARFTREAKTASKLKSPHAVRIRDVSEAMDHPYIVMEYLEGENLAAWLKRVHLRPVPFVVDTVIEGCEALAEAHRAGIIHRDIKPENLFLATTHIGEPIAKLLDFGISKPQQDSSITTTTGVLGTPLYMSPEQLKGSRTLDARTDIWSMGATLHALLCGTPPFTGDSSAEIAAMIIRDSAVRARSLREDVPEALEAVILKALSKAPDARFQSITEFALALEAFCSDRGTRALSLMRRSEVLGASKFVQHNHSDAVTFGTDPTLRAAEIPQTESAEVPLEATRTASTWGGGAPSEKKRAATWAIAATLLVAFAAAGVVSNVSHRTPVAVENVVLGSDGRREPATQVSANPLRSEAREALPLGSTAPATTAGPAPSAVQVPSASASARKKVVPRAVPQARPSPDVYEQRN